MADLQPDLVYETIRRLGHDRGQMRDANRRWQAMMRSRSFPRGLRGRRLVLGVPAESGEQTVGAVAFMAHRWALPLWPELRYEVLEGPEGVLWNEWLVRARDSPPPSFGGVRDLTPWSAVVGDLAPSFGNLVHVPGSTPGRWAVAFDGVAADGGNERFVARFVHGLLQRVDRGGPDAEAL